MHGNVNNEIDDENCIKFVLKMHFGKFIWIEIVICLVPSVTFGYPNVIFFLTEAKGTRRDLERLMAPWDADRPHGSSCHCDDRKGYLL